jgi:molybdate transport system substrate-binding protein
VTRTVALLVLALLLANACSPVSSAPASGTTSAPATEGTSPGSRDAVELQVYAAASLKNVLGELAAAYEAANPGTTLVVSADSSAALAIRIEQGAPADVFLSADTRNPQRLADGGLAAGEVVVFTGNELALIVPEGNPGQVVGLRDLERPGLKVVAAGAGVPLTGYTRELLRKAAALQGYPDDFAARYEANVVSREDNVGAVAAKISLGEGDAGIVYSTDARSAKAVEVIPVPAAANVAVSHGAVVIQRSPNADLASAFLAWLVTQEAQDIFAASGFTPAA